MAIHALARENIARTASFDLRHGLTSALVAVESWIERHRQRQALLGLGAEQLKDVGLTEADVYREVEKPFWQA